MDQAVLLTDKIALLIRETASLAEKTGAKRDIFVRKYFKPGYLQT